MAEGTEVQAAVPVLATKLRRPSTPLLLIARPRLLDQLSTYVDRRLILISAPAGYGKTALISHWLDATAGAYAWLSLDEQDNDLATFLLYLVAAIRGAYPDAMAAVEQLLRAPTLLPPPRLADALLQEMAAFPGPLVLALDDYHVIKASDVHALMARLVEHLPPQIHLVVITRADPPLPLDRLRGRQQLGETRAADLRFNAEETRLLLQRMLGPDVSEETVALLEDSTEGWAVGLHLAGLSLRDRSDPAAFARKIAEHGHQAVTEYLLSEVLAGLPQAQVDCLLQTSLFDRFCAPLIDAAQNEDDVKLSGDDFVRAIRRANLFVVSLDDEGTWCRFHHFFQALLRARLGQRYANAEIKATHARAAAWFSAQGLMDEAVMHFLEAGDPVAAARLVEAQVHPALDRENWRQIERWMGLLPADVSSKRPRLLLTQAWLHYIRWQFGGIEARLDAAEGIMREDPAAAGGAETTLQGEIGVLRSTLAQNKGDGELMMRLSEAGIAALRPQTGYVIGTAYLNYIWALQTCGQYETAVEFGRSQLDASGWQPNALNLRVLLALANIHHEMADLPALQDIVSTWRKLARQSGLGLSVAWSQFAQGWLRYQKNELEAADESFRRLVDVAWAAHGRAVVDGYTGLVLTALGRGRPDEAAAHASALNERLLERGMLALVNVVRSLEQRVALAVGSPSALDWRPDPNSTAVPVDLWEQPGLTYVRTLLVVGSPAALVQATELLADSRTRALARNADRRLIETGTLQALVLSAQGHEAAALATLQEAVERAAPGGALRLLADCEPGLIPLLRKLQAAGVAPRYIENVLMAVGEAAAVPAKSTAQPAAAPFVGQATAAETLTNRQIDVLILLAERLSDKEIADRLVLEPVTVKKHVQRIYRRLGVDNRRAAVAQARRLGLI
jgi:LuxR family transcriptional regulator, maltose regulon positive regulatory protein